MVAICIYVVELVVETYGLCLLISLEEWTRIPEANVLNSALIPSNHFGRQVLQRRVRGFLNYLQVVRFSRELDVVRQISSFQLELVRLHHESLHESRNEYDAQKVERRIAARAYRHGFWSRSEEIEREKHALAATEAPIITHRPIMVTWSAVYPIP